MVKRYRSAITGKYVTKGAANRNPRTTVGETDNKSKPRGGGGKKRK